MLYFLAVNHYKPLTSSQIENSIQELFVFAQKNVTYYPFFITLMALKQIDFGTSEYNLSLKLRYDILRKPLGLDFDPKELESEKNDIHIAAFDDDIILGCCFLKHVNNSTVRLRQIAVQNNQRGKGIGESLMNFAENIARDRGYKTVLMDARKESWPFFEKLGYKQDGHEFIKITIPHVIMKKKLV